MTSKISERFCSPDADITISSSDGVLFKVHSKNLEVHSDIFADAQNTTRLASEDDVVHLSENADVLGLLFQYMYRQPQPDLRNVEFEVFAGLAEAAEKYAVHSALTLCRLKMSESIPAHPLEVLDYAERHGHDDLANESARQSMGLGVTKALEVLAPDTFRAWVQFYDRWQNETRLTIAKFQVQCSERWQNETATRITTAKNSGKVSTKNFVAALDIMKRCLQSPNPGVDKELCESLRTATNTQWKYIGKRFSGKFWMDLDFTSMQKGEYEATATHQYI
ncbi:hypothetical protein C8J57DRAFT_522873 [Mycena rebaudengoi]|nr:hypothetical protein C8J57DRAFT_522873 [Mycena rebaudengoi]